MRDVLRAGADKVSLNTAAVADPTLVSRCAARFGRQAVVVAIDARRRTTDDDAAPSWEVVVKGGREPTGLDAVEWARRVVDLGAGELLVTSIDRDGTRSGLRHGAASGDHARGCPCPSSPRGGAAGPADFVAAVRDGGADAVLAASIFHRRIHSIADVKAAMAAAGPPGPGESRDRGRAVRGSLRPGRARAGRRPGRRRRAGLDGRLDGRRGPGRDHRDGRGPLPLPLPRPAVAEGRDESATSFASSTSPPTATRMRSSSRPSRPDRPATAGRGAASTPKEPRPSAATQGFAALEALWATIASRVAERPAGSYTTSLLEGGVDAAGRKVTEEATEVLLAAKDDAAAESAAADREATRARLAEETADLLYHALVLLAERGIEPGAVLEVLRVRRR